MFCVDRFFKNQAIATDFPPLAGLFGWKPFLNEGIAFSIPIPAWLVALATVPFLVVAGAGILLIATKKIRSALAPHPFPPEAAPLVLVSLTLMFSGALSNFIDRLLYRAVVDYIAIYTAVINIADLLIVAGGVGGFVAWRKYFDETDEIVE